MYRSTFIAIRSVDKAGRKTLLIPGALCMLAAQSWCVICFFVNNYAWSSVPIGWLIASEIFPLEITFIIAQAFMTMLCYMRANIFFIFAAILSTMTIGVIAILPETKAIPLDEMVERAWMQHWFWKRFTNYLVAMTLKNKCKGSLSNRKLSALIKLYIFY
ncbi:Major facilitator superfamily protein, putative [Theobroma cacao]|uniref:Major facilitator superfamily protein, putative n=1 Tax=Theobroma cacao TaxID=3641 RepID=A0A061GWJ9_THECC|nr:Major facilitator superfamily protein, putative [Theobroma cacao]